MKIIPLSRTFSSLDTGHELMDWSKEKEKEGDALAAIKGYEKMVRKGYQKETGFQRMMILYRNLGESKLELELLDRAIEEFKLLFEKRHVVLDRKAALTSKRLAKLMELPLDLSDYPQPLPRWIKRRDLLKKKLKIKSKK